MHKIPIVGSESQSGADVDPTLGARPDGVTQSIGALVNPRVEPGMDRSSGNLLAKDKGRALIFESWKLCYEDGTHQINNQFKSMKISSTPRHHQFDSPIPNSA